MKVSAAILLVFTSGMRFMAQGAPLDQAHLNTSAAHSGLPGLIPIPIPKKTNITNSTNPNPFRPNSDSNSTFPGRFPVPMINLTVDSASVLADDGGDDNNDVPISKDISSTTPGTCNVFRCSACMRTCKHELTAKTSSCLALDCHNNQPCAWCGHVAPGEGAPYRTHHGDGH